MYDAASFVTGHGRPPGAEKPTQSSCYVLKPVNVMLLKWETMKTKSVLSEALVYNLLKTFMSHHANQVISFNDDFNF